MNWTCPIIFKTTMSKNRYPKSKTKTIDYIIILKTKQRLVVLHRHLLTNKS